MENKEPEESLGITIPEERDISEITKGIYNTKFPIDANAPVGGCSP